MPQVLPPPVALSKVGRAAHDVGLAGLLGGNLYGRLAMHPSVTAISDERERGKVINAAWRRYGTINALSLAAVDGHPVAVRQGTMLAISFHPEIAGESRVHELFLRGVRERLAARQEG